MRVVVLGGTGFLGSRTVAALRRFPGVDVDVASRRGPLTVDLSRPETFAALRGADVVVDLTDGTRSQPDALAAFCLEQGLTLIEATSDAETVRRLREGLRASPGPGRVVLGGRRRPTLLASLAEAEMLPFSTGAASVGTCFAPRPGFLVTAFVLLPRWLLRQAWFRGLLAVSFVGLRKVLLRHVPGAVHMVASAERGGQRVERHLTCDDGMAAGAWALAAMAEAVVKRPPPPGLCFIDDAVSLEPVLARANEVAGRAVLTLG